MSHTILRTLFIGAAIAFAQPSPAATPPGGTLTDTSGALTYTFGPQPSANVSNNTEGTDPYYVCSPTDVPYPCDTYALTIDVSAAYLAAHPNAKFVVEPTTTSTASDIDSQLEELDGTYVTVVRDNPPAQPTIRWAVPVGAHTYNVQVVPGSPHEGGSTLIWLDPGPPPPPPPGHPADIPRYENFYPGQGVATFAGEPSIGCNWLTEQVFTNTNIDGSTNSLPNGGRVNYFGGFMSFMLRATFNDCASPAYVTWDEMPLTLAATPRALGDPIMFTDPVIGRSWVIQLEPGAGATIDYTDDDGDDGFNPSSGPFASANDFDHETIGSGPYHAPLTGAEFPLSQGRAVYYAVQGLTQNASFRSDDGGVTFNAKVPMWSIADCITIHGHVKVSPADGTVYVPPRSCGGLAAVAVSEDNGLTWKIRKIPDSTAVNDDDPSLGVATDGTVYCGWRGADGHPYMAVSTDKGLHWSAPYDVGKATVVTNGGPVLNIAFPEVVAGDPDRAAFAFFGAESADPGARATPTTSDPEPCPDCVWYLYISTTFDGGLSWHTTRATPIDDPIQRGTICSDGGCRNLLDFFDAQVDKRGRVLIAGEDGCTSLNCIQDVNYNGPGANDAQAFITRTSGGKRLFAQYDPVEPARPGAPQLTGGLNATQTAANLTWTPADGNGSPITGYNVYKRVGATGPFTQIGTTTVPSFTDSTFDKNEQNFYHVTAVNAIGEGPYCLDFTPTFVILPNPCELPGILVLDDLAQDGSDEDSGQNVPPDPTVNVRQLFVSELKQGTSPDQLTFTLQVAPTTTPGTPNSEWFIIWNRKAVAADGSDRAYVAMRTDGAGAPSFEYGNFGPPLPLDGTPPPPNANAPTKLGDADGGSFDPATGIITMVLLNSRVENLVAGDTLAGLNVRTFAGRSGAPGQRSQNNASDITVDGSYTLSGAASCGLNTPPTALLIGYPGTGDAPLTVTFDVSGSADPDDGDSIAHYYLSFGDEFATEVIDPTQPVTHVYTQAGTYTASLTVEDSRGLSSTPSAAAQFIVTVLDPNAKGTADVGNNRLGGALPALSLAVLGLLGLAARHRRSGPRRRRPAA